MKQTILGNCPSKSNSYRVSGNRMIKSDSLRRFEDNFFIQCGTYRDANITGYFELHLDVYYPSQRSDLDNALKVVLDSLQRANAFPNDNKCVGIFARKFLDKNNPRIEFEIKRV